MAARLHIGHSNSNALLVVPATSKITGSYKDTALLAAEKGDPRFQERPHLCIFQKPRVQKKPLLICRNARELSQTSFPEIGTERLQELRALNFEVLGVVGISIWLQHLSEWLCHMSRKEAGFTDLTSLAAQHDNALLGVMFGGHCTKVQSEVRLTNVHNE